MVPSVIVVKAALDRDAGVWFIESSDLPGLNAEAATLDELVAKLPAVITDLVAASRKDGDTDGDAVEIPVELIAHASTRARIRAAAA